jgi:phage terminase large subunit-like protein
VQKNLRSSMENVPVKLVDATKGKIIRAEPVSRLWEQKKAFFWGTFPVLEDQMCMYTGEESEESPDHLDALVWGAHELMLTGIYCPVVPPPAMGTAPSYWGGTSEFGIQAEGEFITSY